MRFFRGTRVVTKNFVIDWVNDIRNTFGFRLPSWEIRINEAYDELYREYLEDKDVKSYRFDVESAHGGICIVALYCEYNE